MIEEGPGRCHTKAQAVRMHAETVLYVMDALAGVAGLPEVTTVKDPLYIPSFEQRRINIRGRPKPK